MEVDLIEILATYRMVVGYLGEKEQFGWWQSSFFTSGSDAFLSPIFSRTQVLAKCNGVTRAAALVHDERIGVGHVYHLFRLPEEIEQGIHQVLYEPTLRQAVEKIIATSGIAMDYLRKSAGSKEQTGIGPTRVGDIEALYDPNIWHIVGSLYQYAFGENKQIFPYFVNLS